MYINEVHDVDMKPDQFWFCSIACLVVLASIQCSTYLIIVMTFERFYSIIRPHKAASFNTVKRAKTIIICIFVFSFAYYSPHLYISGNNGKMCIPNRFANINIYGTIFHWVSEVINFVLPFVFLLTMNSVIIHTLRLRSKANLMGSEDQGQNQNQTHRIKIKQSEKQIFTTLLLVTFTYLILTIPGKFLIFYLNFFSGNTPYYYAGLYLLYQVGEKTLYSNHGVNFFLYVMSGQKFRTDLQNLFISKKITKNKQTDVSRIMFIASS